MTPVRVILLAADGEPCPWLIASRSGEVTARGLIAPGDVIPESGGNTVVIVPGEDILIRWLDLPGRTETQRRTAAAWLLRDDLGQGPDRVDAILAPPSGPGPRLVAVVAQGVIAAWSARIEALGVKPDVLLPDSLLLDPPEDPEALRALCLDDRLLMRGAGLAFSGETDLVELIVGSRPVKLEPPEALETLMIRKALAPEINLLVRVGPERSAGRGWLRAGVMAALLALSPLLHLSAATLHDELGARRLESASSAAVSAAFPEADGGAAPLEEIRRLSRDGPFSGGAVAAAALLAQALQSSGGARLESFILDEGRIRATVSYEADSDLQAFLSEVRRLGGDVTVTSTVDEEARTATDLILRRPA